MGHQVDIEFISDEVIKKLRRREEKSLSDNKEVINQWRGSLLIFAGLAIDIDNC